MNFSSNIKSSKNEIENELNSQNSSGKDIKSHDKENLLTVPKTVKNPRALLISSDSTNGKSDEALNNCKDVPVKFITVTAPHSPQLSTFDAGFFTVSANCSRDI